MKRFFFGALLLFAVLYLAAEVSLERPPDDGVVRLRWATDPNPARKLQVEIFGKLQVWLKREDVGDWPAFCRKLARGAGADAHPALRRLWSKLDADARTAARNPPAETDEIVQRVAEPINRLMERGDLFDLKQDLAGLELSEDAEILLDKPRNKSAWERFVGTPQGPLTPVEVTALNRRVLEAAFGDALVKAKRIECTVEHGIQEKLIVQCATGIGPDVIDCYTRGQMITYVEAGLLVDVTERAGEMGFGPRDTYPAIGPALKVDGRQYRYPCNVNTDCLVYNKAVFDDHGVPYPTDDWDYDRFIELARQIVEKPSRSGARHLALAHYNSTGLIYNLLLSFGGQLFTPDGLTSGLDSPEAIAAMRLYHDMMHVHRIIPTPADAKSISAQGGWGTGSLNWFSGERAAMIFIGRWYLVQVPNYPGLSERIAAVLPPHVKGRPKALRVGTRAAGVNVNSPHREAALKWMQYLGSSHYGMCIVRDGDALPPNPKLAKDGPALVNHIMPDPDFHRVFVDSMRHGHTLIQSPFVDAMLVDRWVTETTQKVESKTATPAEGMKTLAQEINHLIRTNLQRHPHLRRKFKKITGKDWAPGWRYEHVKPPTSRHSDRGFTRRSREHEQPSRLRPAGDRGRDGRTNGSLWPRYHGRYHYSVSLSACGGRQAGKGNDQ